jgi:hypothetical protein
MAKLGINCVRFHHMDMQMAPAESLQRTVERWSRNASEPGLIFLISKLKEQGIYADLNLHVSRTHPDRPKAEKAGNADY